MKRTTVILDDPNGWEFEEVLEKVRNARENGQEVIIIELFQGRRSKNGNKKIIDEGAQLVIVYKFDEALEAFKTVLGAVYGAEIIDKASEEVNTE